MEKKRLKLPVGIPTFEELRSNGYVYVDKTKYLVELIDSGKIYFLARPRRFGKSLTVSTFEALFSGWKHLFKGLYAEEFVNRPDFEPIPVIWLDMSKISTSDGIEGMKKSILNLTNRTAKKLGIELSDSNSTGDLLGELIEEAAKKYNQKVVILLDEYDKPYTDFVNDIDMANKVRNILRDYYSQIKANDRYLRFTFITGISKFARFGVFSTLNNVEDISLMPKYAEICGYTEGEIVRYFPDYLEETANEMRISTQELIEKMRHYYNGFCFDREAKARLYNPFSTLLFFREMDFANFWIESGKSKLIADYMKDRRLTVEQFRGLSVSKDFARSPGDMDETPPEGFLYQAGYLTLRKGDRDELALDYPNTEVLNSMSGLLAQNLLAKPVSQLRDDLFTALDYNDMDELTAQMNRLLAGIPYDDYSVAAKQVVYKRGYGYPAQEWLYRSNILSFLRGCGVVVDAELHTHLGRPDLVITWQGKTWIIEIKVAYKGESAEKKAEEAYRQIIERQYAKPFPGAICVGLGIDDTLRQIVSIKN